MDKLDEFGFFVLNILMLALLATLYWGLQALIIYGVGMAFVLLGLLLLACLEAALRPAQEPATKKPAHE